MSRRPKSSDSPARPLVEPLTEVDQPFTERDEVPQYSERQICLIVGRNLRESRRRLGITQTEAAERIGSAANYIGTIERGDANISLGMLCRLSSVVGVSPQALMQEALLGDDPSESFHKLALALQENIAVQRALLASSVSNCETIGTAIKTIFEARHKL